MIRRMFRRGVRLGALAGIAYGVSRLVQSRRQQATYAPLPTPSIPPPSRPAPVRAPQPEPAPAPEPAPEAAVDEVAVEADPELSGDAPPAPPTPTGEFNLPRVRPDRPSAATRETAKRAPARPAARSVKRTSNRTSVAAKAWVEASGSVCPPSHPVKAKKTSFLYHLPGMSAYERTKPDRCYRDENAARADGFLPAKR